METFSKEWKYHRYIQRTCVFHWLKNFSWSLAQIHVSNGFSFFWTGAIPVRSGEGESNRTTFNECKYEPWLVKRSFQTQLQNTLKNNTRKSNAQTMPRWYVWIEWRIDPTGQSLKWRIYFSLCVVSIEPTFRTIRLAFNRLMTMVLLLCFTIQCVCTTLFIHTQTSVFGTRDVMEWKQKGLCDWDIWNIVFGVRVRTVYACATILEAHA